MPDGASTSVPPARTRKVLWADCGGQSGSSGDVVSMAQDGTASLALTQRHRTPSHFLWRRLNPLSPPCSVPPHRLIAAVYHVGQIKCHGRPARLEHWRNENMAAEQELLVLLKRPGIASMVPEQRSQHWPAALPVVCDVERVEHRDETVPPVEDRPQVIRRGVVVHPEGRGDLLPAWRSAERQSSEHDCSMPHPRYHSLCTVKRVDHAAC